ncbi:MAG: glutathione S-transferase, partial [Mangrovicoccus sp.]
LARDRFGGDGPWLFGAYSLADVFFAPVAARIMGYSLPVPDEARAYAMTHLTDPAFRRWRAFGAVHPVSPAPYPMDMPQIPWPGPQSSGAEALEAAPEQAPNCLVTGKEAAYFLRYQDETYGFASTDLRDAMCFDPEAFVQP